MPPRYAKKVDVNHQEIRDGLRQLGFEVLDTSALGNGMSDLVVAVDDVTYFIEIKNGNNPMTPAELAFKDMIRERAVYKVVYSIEEAVQLVERG
jgi:hypothetical protein